ncbi:MAG: DNA methyltransferase [Alphaproteobacteria bacterium]|nr:MAG: DNA methyltransferase [Alphaproteobacteria bacterium]
MGVSIMPTSTDPTTNTRAMRHALTPAEAALWIILRSKPLDAWHFRRQVAFKPLYIADFASHTARLVIEADGPSHDLTCEADLARTAWFGTRGYRVLRFRNSDILSDRQSVWREICRHLPEGGPPPRSRKRESPSPQGGGS